MQTNIEIHRTQTTHQFVHPDALLQNLLLSLNSPCNCGQAGEDSEAVEHEVNEEIKGAQLEISNIRAEVLEVENLLHARDSLYKELDQLREEREHIESEIESSSTVEQVEVVKSSGYREMNERLRRRIFEVREFIQKMTFENQRIEEGIISNQYIEEEYQLRRREAPVPQQQPVYEGRRFYNTSSNFESMVAKLHDKQEEAWRKVRRQEDEIERRNNDARSRKGNTNSNAFTYYSPKPRTYYSPNK
jgi:flagellar biosynthesis/type III secretory pathway chaperone